MRAFLAIPLPSEIQIPLAAEAVNFPGLRPVRAEQMHLTLRFLGDVPHRALRSVMDVVGPVAAAQASFEITLKSLDCFPNRKKALVVWTAVGEGDLQASALVHGIENALQTLGFDREARPWRGHVTLGRFKKPTRVSTKLLVPEADFGRFRADEVVLFSSELRPDGPLHTPMHRMKLRGPMEAEERPAVSGFEP